MKRLRDPISNSRKRATVLGSGIDGAVRRIAFEFSDRGLLSKVICHNHAIVGSGTIVNHVGLG